MRIYISLPISNLDFATQQATAAQVAERIKRLGHEPVNPFDTPLAPPGMSEKETYAYYMGRDLEKLLLCDAALFCEGWRGSNGCLLEFYAAQTYAITRYVNINDIPALK